MIPKRLAWAIWGAVAGVVVAVASHVLAAKRRHRPISEGVRWWSIAWLLGLTIGGAWVGHWWAGERTDVYRARGIHYYTLNRYDLALADLTRAIELDPNAAPTYCYRGLIYGSLKESEKALADYARAIELDPNNDFAYAIRGAEYAKTEQYDQALADYGRAIELQPQAAPIYHWRATVYVEMGEVQLAQADLRRALELDPDDELARERLAEIAEEGASR